MAESIEDFVVGNRILADQGVIADGFGHLSFRSPADPGRFFMARARGAAMVTADDIMEFGLDGRPLDQRDRRMFGERFIHAEIYKARPDVMAIVHSHAPLGAAVRRDRHAAAAGVAHGRIPAADGAAVRDPRGRRQRHRHAGEQPGARCRARQGHSARRPSC